MFPSRCASEVADPLLGMWFFCPPICDASFLFSTDESWLSGCISVSIWPEKAHCINQEATISVPVDSGLLTGKLVPLMLVPFWIQNFGSRAEQLRTHTSQPQSLWPPMSPVKGCVAAGLTKTSAFRSWNSSARQYRYYYLDGPRVQLCIRPLNMF